MWFKLPVCGRNHAYFFGLRGCLAGPVLTAPFLTVLRPAEVAGLRQLFQQLDEEAEGVLSQQQLREALGHMGREVWGGGA